jgi:cold shock protein
LSTTVSGQRAHVDVVVVVVTVVGRVVRFDGSRGYGFIAPANGGEDVFLHVNDTLIPEEQLHQGLAVEFEIVEGDRGPKASSVQLAPEPGGNGPVAPVSPQSPVEPEAMCDVLRTDEYLREVTEILLTAAPSLTGEQILRIRARLAEWSSRHGWTDA